MRERKMKYELKNPGKSWWVKGMIIEGEEGTYCINVVAEDIVRLNKDIMSSDEIYDCLAEGDDFVWWYDKEKLELIED